MRVVFVVIYENGKKIFFFQTLTNDNRKYTGLINIERMNGNLPKANLQFFLLEHI